MIFASWAAPVNDVRKDATPRIKSVRGVVDGLQRELGRPVEVSSPLRGLPVLVDEPGRSPEDRLRDLAFSLHASLVQDGKALRIERTADDQKRIAAIHQRVLRDRAQTALATYERLLKASSTLGGQAAQERAAQQAIVRVQQELEAAREAGHPYTVPADLFAPWLLKPEGHLALELMRRVGPDGLNQLSKLGIRILSDHPLAGESPLPASGDLVAEYNRRVSSDAITPSSRLVLIVGETGVKLQAFNAGGQMTVSTRVDYVSRPVVYGSGLPQPGGADAVWRTLDDRARAMVDFLKPDDAALVAALQRGNEAASTMQPAALLPFPASYLQPEIEDPLDFVVREGVLAIAPMPKTSGRIVVLSDDLLGLADALVEKGRLDVATFERALLRDGYPLVPRYERLVGRGVSVLRPVDMQWTETRFVDRSTLGRVLRRVVADGRIDLDNWPKAHLDLYGGLDSDVEHRYLGALLLLGLRHCDDVLVPNPHVLALAGAAVSFGVPVVDGKREPLLAMVRSGIAKGWLAIKRPPSFSDMDASPAGVLGALTTRDLLVPVVSTEIPVVDNAGKANVGFVGQRLGHVAISRLYPFPEMPRTESNTRLLFEQRYLHPLYRVGRQRVLSVGVVLGGVPLTQMTIQDSVLDRTKATFDQLPVDFRDDLLHHVRAELEKEGTPVPRFLYGEGG